LAARVLEWKNMTHNERLCAMTSKADFPHRENADLTFDAICPKCFQTVSNQKLENDLKEHEVAHVCYGGSIGTRV
jgi:hypothetical protein